jgi:sugar transferase (PEP-CTERM system associated)
MSVGSGEVEARKVAFFAGEQLLLFAAFTLTASAFLHLGRFSATKVAWGRIALEAGAATLLLQLGLYLADLYDLKTAYQDAREGARLTKALGFATIGYALFSICFDGALPGPRLAYPVAAAALGVACTVALGFRTLLPELGRRMALRGRVFLLGAGEAARALADEIARDGTCEVVGQAAPAAGDLLERVRARAAETVVVAADDRRGLPIRELLACRLSGLEVVDAASFAERALRTLPVALVRPSDLVFSDGFLRPSWLVLARRLVSLLAAGILLVLALPWLLVIALLVKLDSKGPILYQQERVGAGGRSFKMLKFRTMRNDAEAGGARWAAKDDPRVTRVGRWLRRFRIDELPQLWNVLIGDMGLIGPRPERPEFVARLRTQIPYYDLRSLVPPGITGWAQIRYPYAASLEEAREKLKYDLYYVKHLSVRLDLVILFHTAKVVLFGRGAR